MAGLWKYFQRQSLPNSKETGGEVITNEANAAVERVLEEERNGAKGIWDGSWWLHRGRNC